MTVDPVPVYGTPQTGNVKRGTVEAQDWDLLLMHLGRIETRSASTAYSYRIKAPSANILATNNGTDTVQLDQLFYGSQEPDRAAILSLKEMILTWFDKDEVDASLSSSKVRKDISINRTGWQLNLTSGDASNSDSTHSSISELQRHKNARDWDAVIKVASTLLHTATDTREQLDLQQDLAEAHMWKGNLEESRNRGLACYRICEASRAGDFAVLERSAALLANIYDLEGQSSSAKSYIDKLSPKYTGPLFRHVKHSWLAAYQAHITPDGQTINIVDDIGTLRDLTFKAMEFHDINVLRLIMGNDDIKIISQSGLTLLTIAATSGFLEGVDYLIMRKADVNYPGMDKYTPLMAASATGNLDMVAKLMTLGAKPNVKTVFDRMEALHYAASARSYAICEYLLTHGAKTNHSMTSDLTPLHFAALAGQPDIVELLFKHNAVLDTFDFENFHAPLHYAAIGGNTACAALLLDRGVYVNKRDKAWYTPLNHALLKGHQAMVELLVSKGGHLGVERKVFRTKIALH